MASNDLLSSIQGFKKGKLKKAETNDRSGPMIDNKPKDNVSIAASIEHRNLKEAPRFNNASNMPLPFGLPLNPERKLSPRAPNLEKPSSRALNPELSQKHTTNAIVDTINNDETEKNILRKTSQHLLPSEDTKCKWVFPDEITLPPVPEFVSKSHVYYSGNSKGSSLSPLPILQGEQDSFTNAKIASPRDISSRQETTKQASILPYSSPIREDRGLPPKFLPGNVKSSLHHEGSSPTTSFADNVRSPIPQAPPTLPLHHPQHPPSHEQREYMGNLHHLAQSPTTSPPLPISEKSLDRSKPPPPPPPPSAPSSVPSYTPPATPLPRAERQQQRDFSTIDQQFSSQNEPPVTVQPKMRPKIPPLARPKIPATTQMPPPDERRQSQLQSNTGRWPPPQHSTPSGANTATAMPKMRPKMPPLARPKIPLDSIQNEYSEPAQRQFHATPPPPSGRKWPPQPPSQNEPPPQTGPPKMRPKVPPPGPSKAMTSKIPPARPKTPAMAQSSMPPPDERRQSQLQSNTGRWPPPQHSTPSGANTATAMPKMRPKMPPLARPKIPLDSIQNEYSEPAQRQFHATPPPPSGRKWPPQPPSQNEPPPQTGPPKMRPKVPPPGPSKAMTSKIPPARPKIPLDSIQNEYSEPAQRQFRATPPLPSGPGLPPQHSIPSESNVATAMPKMRPKMPPSGPPAKPKVSSFQAKYY